MKRLTKRNFDGTSYVPSYNMQTVIDRLAKYEDAEEEGRLFTSTRGIGDLWSGWDTEGDFHFGTITDISPNFIYTIDSGGKIHKYETISSDIKLGL